LKMLVFTVFLASAETVNKSVSEIKIQQSLIFRLPVRLHLLLLVLLN
jgi:hypothetical protein